MSDSSHYQQVLMGHVPSMLGYWDADMRCRFANQAYQQWFGVNPASLVGSLLPDLLGPELFAQNEPYIRAALGGQEQTFERIVPGPGGVIRHSLANYLPDIVDGVVVGFVVQVTDVTPLKQAQAVLAHNEEYLRALFTLSSECVLVADPDGHYVDLNQASADMLGYPREELIGKTFEDLLCEPEQERLLAARARLREGQPHTEEWALRRKDGSAIAAEVRARFLPDGRRVGFLRDITERRRAEDELRTGKATLETALASMSDAVCITDTQCRLVNFNDAFAAFHRFSTKEECRLTFAQYQDMFDVMLPSGEVPAVEQWVIPRALRGEAASDEEYTLRRKSTGQTWIGSFSFAPIRSQDGHIVGAVCSARDITELKRRQAELETAHTDLQRLIASQDQIQEEERKRIARDLHDDLQQTLAAIKIDVGVIEQKFAAAPLEVVPMLAKVDELASSAIASTRRIVNALQPQVLDELGLVPALDMLAREFSERTGIACQVEALGTAGEASVGLASITTPLYRITQEALNNVFKHARATRVHIRLGQSGNNRLVLRITDNGAGMSVADRKKAHSFGLLGMQERVRALGGALSIESQLGAGTSIEVLVPIPGTRVDSESPDSPQAPAADVSEATGASIQAAIDALPGHIAVLDPQGVIRFVNRAWREFAERNGDPGLSATGPDVNYVEVCRRSAHEDEHAGLVLKGLIEVIDGSRQEFMSAYPCHSPDEQRWFLVRVAPTSDGHFQVAHMDVTHLAQPVRMAEPRPLAP